MADDQEIVFNPVSVNKGRKFKGDAYELGLDPRISNSCWAYTSWSIKLWCPAQNKYVYANPKYLEPRECSKEQIEADKTAYVDSVIKSTLEWCRSKSPNEESARAFARRCLVNNHPEMMKKIDEVLPDERDVVAAVKSTLEWAINLKSRPMMMYGKMCKGGKPYGKTTCTRKALKALEHKGITRLDGFKNAWVIMTTIMGLPDLGIKADVEEIEEPK